jgi:anti-anti-sigma regulatory factor
MEDAMALMFTLSDFGQTFATRERGAELREQLLGQVADHDEIVVDFAGVTNVSYSFADEFLAKLCVEAGVPVRRTSVTPQIARIADRAVERRTGTLAC